MLKKVRIRFPAIFIKRKRWETENTWEILENATIQKGFAIRTIKGQKETKKVSFISIALNRIKWNWRKSKGASHYAKGIALFKDFILNIPHMQFLCFEFFGPTSSCIEHLKNGMSW